MELLVRGEMLVPGGYTFYAKRQKKDGNFRERECPLANRRDREARLELIVSEKGGKLLARWKIRRKGIKSGKRGRRRGGGGRKGVRDKLAPARPNKK